jgi:hypothetical protein
MGDDVRLASNGFYVGRKVRSGGENGQKSGERGLRLAVKEIDFALDAGWAVSGWRHR